MDHSPLQQRLADHLKNRPAPIGVQEVLVGTKPVDDGWVIAFLRIDGCTSEHQALGSAPAFKTICSPTFEMQIRKMFRPKPSKSNGPCRTEA